MINFIELFLVAHVRAYVWSQIEIECRTQSIGYILCGVRSCFRDTAANKNIFSRNYPRAAPRTYEYCNVEYVYLHYSTERSTTTILNTNTNLNRNSNVTHDYSAKPCPRLLVTNKCLWTVLWKRQTDDGAEKLAGF